jgi:conjugal transfer ATP-binding protein TraC
VCSPLNGGDEKTEARLRTLFQEDWPVGTLVQLTLVANQNIVGALERIRYLRKDLPAGILRELIEARVALLRRAVDVPLVQAASLHVRDFELIVSVQLPCPSNPMTDEDMEVASQRQRRVLNGLRECGLAPVPMDADDFVRVLSGVVNRGEDASWRVSGGNAARDDVFLSEQIFDSGTDLRVERDGVWLDDVFVSLFSPKAYPTWLHFGLGAYLIGDVVTGQRGLRFPFIVSMTVSFPDAFGLRSKLASKRNYAVSMASGSVAKWLPHIGSRARDMELITRSMDEGNRPLKVCLTAVVFSSAGSVGVSLEDRCKAARNKAISDQSSIVSYWAENLVTLMRDRFVALPLFINSLPFCADPKGVVDLGRYRTMTSNVAARLAPVFGAWKGTGTPSINLISREGQVMNLCLFDSSTNFNATIAAESGSGKSFFANEMIVSYLSRGALIRVIDVGKSYENLCRMLDGKFIDFDPSASLGLNPFRLIKNYDEESSMLVSIIGAMAAPTPETPLSDLERSILERILGDIWLNKNTNMKIDDIHERLMAHDDQRAKDIGTRLYKWTSDGPYGKHFNGDSSADFGNPFTVLELEHLRNHKDLQRIVLLMLIYSIQQEMFLGPRDQEKLIFIDEAWDLLADGEVGRFIENGYRRFRKYKGAAITITQSMADFYGTRVGQAIVANSANMFLLGQKSDVIDRLIDEKKLPLGEFQARVLKSVHTSPGNYSQIFAVTDRGWGVGMLIASATAQITFSTQAKDKSAVDAYCKRGLSVSDAVKAVLRDRGHIDAAQ